VDASEHQRRFVFAGEGHSLGHCVLAPGREEDDGLMLPQMLRQLRRRSGMLQMVQIGDELVATCSLACTGGSPSSTTDAIIFLTPRGEYTVSHTVSFTGEDESMVMLRGIHSAVSSGGARWYKSSSDARVLASSRRRAQSGTS
jgi:hypothetical protein